MLVHIHTHTYHICTYRTRMNTICTVNIICQNCQLNQNLLPCKNFQQTQVLSVDFKNYSKFTTNTLCLPCNGRDIMVTEAEIILFWSNTTSSIYFIVLLVFFFLKKRLNLCETNRDILTGCSYLKMLSL